MSTDRCITEAWRGFNPRRCLSRAKPGSQYCGVHDPERRAKLDAARRARWLAEAKASALVGLIAETKRRAFEALTVDSTDAEIVAVVRAALAKIEKLKGGSK